MIRFHSDDTMGKKGFSLTYVAVDPLDDLDEIIDEESSEFVTPFPGYISGGSLKYPKRNEDIDEDETEEEEEEEETVVKKKEDDNDDLDEDLVTDNEDIYVYNSNRLGKENAIFMNKHRKKDEEVD
jgi:hypothetical protein